MRKQAISLVLCVLCMAQPVQAKENLRAVLQELTVEITALKNQLQQSKDRIKELEQKRRFSSVRAAPALVAKVTTVAANTNHADKVEKPLVTEGDVKNSFKIPETNISLRFGGMIKTDFLFSDVSAGRDKYGDQYLVYSQIPLGKSPGEHSQITVHAKQSRFWVRSFMPSAWGDINTRIEADFFNDAAIDAYTLRLRHAYGSIGHFLAGQTWSTFLNDDASPDLLDFGGPAGALTGVRQPQLRWTQPFTVNNTAMEFQLALESPRSRIRDNPQAASDVFTVPFADRYPDLIGRVNVNPSWAKLSFASMARQIRNSDPVSGQVQAKWGQAISFAGMVNTQDSDNIYFMLNYGNVLGRYSASSFEDAVLSHGNLYLIDIFSAMFSYQHFWSKDWQSYLAYGFIQADQPDIAGGNITRQAQSFHGNLLWTPVSQIMLGMEYIYATRKVLDGRHGDLHRVQFSARYSF